MKKVLTTGMVAICLIAVTQQEASAWVNRKFGIGLNWERQSGGNNFLWGAYHNGQVPGPESFQNGPFHGGPFYNAPAPSSPPFTYFGSAPQDYAPFAQGPASMPSHEPNYAPPSINHGSPYQFATYPRPAYYYSTPYYYGR